MMDKLFIDGNSLTIKDVIEVSLDGRRVEISKEARHRLTACRQYVESKVSSSKPIYGINTGFGGLCEKRITNDMMERLQRNLIVSHACGIGEHMDDPQLRAMMLLRANVLAKGYSGVRVQIVDCLVEMLNRKIHPVVPKFGSVGASGDLVPLAHLAQCMMGEGMVKYRGRTMKSSEAMRRAGIETISFEAKEGLSMINGTQAMAAIGVLAVRDAELLADAADVAGAMSIEGLMGTPEAFDELIHNLRPIGGQLISAKNLRDLLKESRIAESHKHCPKVQDPYSLRCMPQVHGATRECISHAKKILEIEINSATDNPLVFPNEDRIISGGNFHGQPVALALDYMAIGVCELADISERRIEQLVNPQLSGLPPFLTDDAGINSGFMMAQVLASSLINRCRTLAVPASTDSIPSSANREDHVSMGMNSAIKVMEVIEHVRVVIAIEMMCAAQAIDYRMPLSPGLGVRKAYEMIRKEIKPLKGDRNYRDDIISVAEMIKTGKIQTAAFQ